jgi:hypothetical protein
MTSDNINPGDTGQREPVHHATVFGYSTPTTCGKTDQPKPCTNNWRHVTCDRCVGVPLGLMKVER